MKTDFTFLLSEAVSKPGILSDAYSVFHEYSVGNMMLALRSLMTMTRILQKTGCMVGS